MLTVEFHLSLQGSRTEQLDRFMWVETGRCRLFMMADGFSRCGARPHYVDWLTMHLERMKDSGRDLHAVCHDISALVRTADHSPGRASVAFVIADDREYHYASLGDTRIYWLNSRDRTRDHSLAERCVSLGQCPPDAIRFHPLRNRLFAWAGNARGSMHEVKWHQRACQQDQSLLLCTDGFWSQVSDADIYTIRSAAALGERCTRLSADNSSSPDNLTVALLRQRPGC